MAFIFDPNCELSTNTVIGAPYADRASSPALAPTLVNIDGQAINVYDQAHAIASIIKRLSYPKSFLACTLNLHHLVMLRSVPEFRTAYARAELVTADGFPIVTLSQLRGCHLQRTTGSDLIEPLCAVAAQHRLPIFLLGSTFSVLRSSARQLVAANPTLEIAGVYAPSRNFDVNSTEADEVIAMIRDSGTRLCFIALGAPLQEIFSARAIDETSGVAFLPIGAGLDFIAGAQVRCPPLLQRLRLEWAWRLAKDPYRLWLRYIRCAILFVELITRESAYRIASWDRT